MSLIKEALDGSQFKVIQIKLLDGSEEATNSWTAANFMKVFFIFPNYIKIYILLDELAVFRISLFIG